MLLLSRINEENLKQITDSVEMIKRNFFEWLEYVSETKLSRKS